MSLIKCPECGNQVSTKAPYCPNCGVPILHNVKRCPICNSLALMDAEQCPHCEARFVITALPSEQPEPPKQTGQHEDARNLLSTQAHKQPVTSEGTVLPAPGSEPKLHVEPEGTQQSGKPVGTPLSEEPEETTNAGSPQKPKKSSAPWWLLILAIILVAIGGFFYYEHQQHEATEEKDYERLQNCTEKENFQDFLNRYPESKHTDNVMARLQELQRIDNEWAVACENPSQEKLQQFIDQHPSSIYKAVAIHKIDSLDWMEADRRGTAAAYALYIGRHESGEHIEQAFIARDEADRREAQARRDSIEAAQAARRDSLAAETPSAI